MLLQFAYCILHMNECDPFCRQGCCPGPVCFLKASRRQSEALNVTLGATFTAGVRRQEQFGFMS